MYMEKGLDTGDMLLWEEVEITPEMTAGELHDILAVLGGKVLLETLDHAEKGTLNPIKQDDSLSTYASQLTKAEGEIDWGKSNTQIINKIRGLNPWPMAYSFLSGKRFVIDAAFPLDESGIPGSVLSASAEGIKIACGKGSILIKNIKIEGKKKRTP